MKEDINEIKEFFIHIGRQKPLTRGTLFRPFYGMSDDKIRETKQFKNYEKQKVEKRRTEK